MEQNYQSEVIDTPQAQGAQDQEPLTKNPRKTHHKKLRVTQGQIERACNMPIVSVLERRGCVLKKNGRGYTCISPFPREKDGELKPESTPSLSVDPERNKWKDFGAGDDMSGDAISLVELLDNCTFQEAVLSLCGDVGGGACEQRSASDRSATTGKGKAEKAESGPTEDHWRFCIGGTIKRDRARDYLLERGLNAQFVADLEEKSVFGASFESDEYCIAFVWYNIETKKLVGIQYISVSGRPIVDGSDRIFHHGSKPADGFSIYGYLDDAETLVICEGVFSAYSAKQAFLLEGKKVAVLATGSVSYTKQLAQLESILPKASGLCSFPTQTRPVGRWYRGRPGCYRGSTV
jgi:hypothetical protein